MKLLTLTGIFTSLVALCSCCTTREQARNSEDDPLKPKANGGVVVVDGGAVSATPGYGKIRAVYVKAGDAQDHPTKWKIDAAGASEVSVGAPAQTKKAQNYRIVFRALKASDTPPKPTTVPVSPKRLTLMKVRYN